ncbi:Phosphodiesterase yfcE [Bhargavaea cecembensis DSE10]|uniref:Phosphoesterase n=1 Tax=Bhargavaea cecembensis DSE10 TaxID=1235279 RepID=M7ND49_9BACL|nr:metallophosphoesterase [Bhargavaea cecembensis]EMR05177.1 Phosphodiesterase yfcE [Bhargavaea cecembensis DSE10]
MTNWRIAVMSDSHGDTETVRHFLDRQSGSDHLIHCGDSELPAEDKLLEGMASVKGNCDPDGLPEYRMLEAGELRVLVTHGHLDGVKSGMLPLRYRAEEAGADLVLFGHTHLYGAEVHDGILFVNPGSTHRPPPGRPATYAVIEEKAEGVSVRFLQPDGTEADSADFPDFQKRR